MDSKILKGQMLYDELRLLTQIDVDGSTWNVYYVNEKTKEKWVKEHLNSSYHGGGEPQLRLLEKFPWE
jgi:hypothetical protein